MRTVLYPNPLRFCGRNGDFLVVIVAFLGSPRPYTSFDPTIPALKITQISNLLIYSPKESSLSIVGLLGLSGSLFLGLLVFDFYQPTNRDLYLVGGEGWSVFLDENRLFQSCFGLVSEVFRLCF